MGANGDGCCGCAVRFDGATRSYRRVLWVVIALNAAMFVICVAAGYLAHSQALQAEALDFLGDTATYGLSLWAIGRSARWRTGAALFKGTSLGALAISLIGWTVWRAVAGGEPEPLTMTATGVLALAVNAAAVLLLFRFRDGDANVSSVWLCSRNDAIRNIAVMLAAAGVWTTGSRWPDLVVALAMAALFLHSALRIVQQGLAERQAASTDTDARRGRAVSSTVLPGLALALLLAPPALAQPASAPDCGRWMMWQYGWVGMMLGPLIMLLLFAGAVALAVVIVRRLGGDRSASGPAQRTAFDILDERFARGEIDAEEYDKRRRSLSR